MAPRTWDELVIKARKAVRRAGGDAERGRQVYKNATPDVAVPALPWARMDSFYLCACGKAYTKSDSRNKHAAVCPDSVGSVTAEGAAVPHRRMAIDLGAAPARVYKIRANAVTAPAMMIVRERLRAAEAEAGAAEAGPAPIPEPEVQSALAVQAAQQSAHRLILTPEFVLPAALRDTGLDVTYRYLQDRCGVSPVIAMRLCGREKAGDRVEVVVRAGVDALLERGRMAREEMRA